MAQTDTRSGFRLPWSSDRAHDDSADTDAAAGAPEAAAEPEAPQVAWPESDFAARLGITPNAPRQVEPGEPGEPAADPAGDAAPETAAPAPAPRKPTKLMADLSAAIRAAAETARDQRLGQVATDAQGMVDLIRAQSSEGAAALRRRSDEDLGAIRDWAKAEIARIKQESDSRVAGRQELLDRELEGHAIAIEDRVAEVESTVAGYRAAMDTYFSRLALEDDPGRLATMAEGMPETPSFEALGDLAGLVVAAVPAAVAIEAEPEVEAASEAEAVVAAPEPDTAPAIEDAIEDAIEAEPVEAVAPVEVEPNVDEADAEGDVEAIVDEAEVETEAEVEPIVGDAGPVEEARATAWPGGHEVDSPAAAGWTSGTAGSSTDAPADDVARWAEGETPDGFPEATEGGDPVDRGAIMAALEAAAEAVVAAEAAAESADQAEAAADVAETAAELLKGRAGTDEELDPEAAAALSARVDAGGFETESYTDRLASLLPGHAEGAADGEPRVTQVVVTGLVSVASIASFKRHVGRLPGVTAVAVASGPDGEFVFNVTHRPDVSFRDSIPSMPGFAARITASGDGVVNVTARDPEAEG